jgi:hypothetical protein
LGFCISGVCAVVAVVWVDVVEVVVNGGNGDMLTSYHSFLRTYFVLWLVLWLLVLCCSWSDRWLQLTYCGV